MGGDGAHVVGDTCTLTCDDGFEPSDSISRQCDNDGSWSGSDPTCDRGECGGAIIHVNIMVCWTTRYTTMCLDQFYYNLLLCIS